MTERLESLIQHGVAIKDENNKYLKWLKTKKPAKLDLTMQAAHNEAFEQIDCLDCANCCKTTSPIFYSKDIERAAKALRMKAVDFERQYLRIDEDGDYVLQSSPCTFLDSDNYCGIYDSRPTACREYPHTDRKNFIQITELTYRNTLVCPAVVSILEKVKEVFVKP
ncbi:MAG: hypothetical protein RL660_888 [Bacteroidota bacterium]|jgi:Fe-S-cluster containining protein